MTVLDVVRPEDCDFDLLDLRGYPGVPLDWERCRKCAHIAGPKRHNCGRCDGHGSLREAALAEVIRRDRLKAAAKIVQGSFSAQTGRMEIKMEAALSMVDDETRCQECHHPMGEDAWEHTDHAHKLRATVAPVPSFPREKFATAVRVLAQGGFDGTFATEGFYTHYSRCDEKCDHWDSGTIRTLCTHGWEEFGPGSVPTDKALREGMVQASWRQVDVRALGHPCDLRPHMLAVLCLRCYSESFQRTQSAKA